MSDRIIYILLPVHNRLNVTMRFAAQLLAQKTQSFHLILLDDGSTDGTTEAIRAILGEKVTVFKGRGDWWWGGALQVGYDLIKSGRIACKDEDIIGIMNDDSMFGPNLFSRVFEAFDSYEGQICLVATATNMSSQRSYVGASVKWVPFRIQLVVDARSMDCAPTRALYMKSRDFKASGGFWPKRIPHYFADYEFTFRIREQGCRFVCPPDMTIEFTEAESGAVRLQSNTIKDRLRTIFSVKCNHNPMPWSWFIARHGRPRVLMPLALIQIWLRAMLRVVFPSSD